MKICFESGYLGRGCCALNIENCDSIAYENYPKASIAMIAIKRFSMLYNSQVKEYYWYTVLINDMSF